VDNDGGARRRPEHDPADAPPPFRVDDDDTCRECWLSQAIPASWSATGGRACVVVPVQAIETWLLFLRGDALTPTPEQAHGYHRPTLKRQFFGKPTPPAATRLALARAELARPDAIELLRARPSFRRFDAAIAGW
jgi:hypothetical protein